MKRAGRDDAATAEGCHCLHMTLFAHDLDLNTYSMLKYTLLIELQPTKVKDLCKWYQQKTQDGNDKSDASDMYQYPQQRQKW